MQHWGRMNQAEFDTLRQMVNGSYQPSDSVTTEIRQNIHVAGFNQTDVDDSRQAMAAGSIQRDATESVANNGMVDIGTGEMPMDDFIALKNMVEGTDIFGLYHLAAAHPYHSQMEADQSLRPDVGVPHKRPPCRGYRGGRLFLVSRFNVG